MHKFRILADHSPFGIFHTDPAGSVTYTNEAWSRISGLSAEDSRRQGWWEVIHPRDRARVRAAWKQEMVDRRGVEFTCRLLRPDNERRFIRISARTLPDGVDGAGGYVGCAVDITEQVMAERRLRRNNQLLTTVLENIPCGVSVFDADGSLVLDNQQFRSLLSLPQHLAGTPITDFGTLTLDGEPRKSPLYFDTGPDATGPGEFDAAPRVREEVQPDGRVLEVRDAPMPSGGLVSTYTDVTQHTEVIESLQQAKAAAEQAAAAKAAFLAVMSHEIRTPMNGVIGLTNLLLNTPLNDEQRELLEDIRRSGESLMVVINDVLDYSKIESGQMQLEWIPLRLRDVIDASVRLVAVEAQERGLDLQVEVGQEVPPLVYGDRTRLQQVLMNLLSNAVKFTEAGRIRLSVALERAKSGRQTAAATGDLCVIVVTVQDTGIGIPEDKLRQLFEPFVQADTSTARRYGGTGLGLAITRRLVEAMGGAASIDSRPGAGTTVTFSFVAEAAAPQPAGTAAAAWHGTAPAAVPGMPDAAVHAPPQPRVEGRPGDRTPLRILLAEDNDINRKVAVRMLRELGYEPDLARNGREVTEAVRRSRYDLVLMDIRMPEMDGVEATRWIHGNLPAQQRPRVVAMSANVMREEVDAALEAGCDDYIGKPFAASTLRAAIERSAPKTVAGGGADRDGARHPLRLLARDTLSRHLGCKGDGAFLGELAESFRHDSARTLQCMLAAVRSGSATELRSAAHELAGMGAVIGAEQLTELCRGLERIARQGGTQGAAALAEQAEAVLEDTVEALDAFLASLLAGGAARTAAH